MTIERIISGCGATAVNGDIRKEVTLVCNDSRKVVPGSLFVAVKGFATDGHDFISTAVKKGACGIVYEDQAAADEQITAAGGNDITMIKVASSRHALAIIAANFYDNPSEKLTLVITPIWRKF